MIAVTQSRGSGPGGACPDKLLARGQEQCRGRPAAAPPTVGLKGCSPREQGRDDLDLGLDDPGRGRRNRSGLTQTRHPPISPAPWRPWSRRSCVGVADTPRRSCSGPAALPARPGRRRRQSHHFIPVRDVTADTSCATSDSLRVSLRASSFWQQSAHSHEVSEGTTAAERGHSQATVRCLIFAPAGAQRSPWVVVGGCSCVTRDRRTMTY